MTCLLHSYWIEGNFRQSYTDCHGQMSHSQMAVTTFSFAWSCETREAHLCQIMSSPTYIFWSKISSDMRNFFSYRSWSKMWRSNLFGALIATSESFLAGKSWGLKEGKDASELVDETEVIASINGALSAALKRIKRNRQKLNIGVQGKIYITTFFKFSKLKLRQINNFLIPRFLSDIQFRSTWPNIWSIDQVFLCSLPTEDGASSSKTRLVRVKISPQVSTGKFYFLSRVLLVGRQKYWKKSSSK